MKITFNSIFAHQAASIRQTNKNSFYLKNNQSYDIFTKSVHPSFGSNNFKDNYAVLEKELSDYCLNASNLSLSTIREIIRKRCPNIEVDDFKNLSTNSPISPRTAAYFKYEIPFVVVDGKLQVDDKINQTIYLNIPKNQTEKERVMFLSRAMHEITHALQENSDDRTSKADYIRKYLTRSTESFDEKTATITSATKAFAYTSNYIMNICSEGLNKKDIMPCAISLNNIKYIDNLYRKICAQDAGSTIEKLLKNVLLSIKNQSDYNIETVLDIVAMTAEREQEAYRNQYEVLKKFKNIKGNADIDIVPMSFGILGDIARDL